MRGKLHVLTLVKIFKRFLQNAVINYRMSMHKRCQTIRNGTEPHIISDDLIVLEISVSNCLMIRQQTMVQVNLVSLL
jgi:hypothetical protein